MSDRTPAERLLALFKGLDRAYGLYSIDGTTSGKGKAQGSARTIGGVVDEELWQTHIDGKAGLGIVPIRDDGTCVFAALDIDEYNLDVESLSRRVVELKLPLVTVRSKSGGAHLYMFLKESTSCRVVRKALLDCAVILGFDGSEIFPKQENLANKTDIGNWINMPYFDAMRTTRYAIVEGAPLSLEDFLDYAEHGSVYEEDLAKIEPPVDDILYEGPPCLQVLTRNGVPEGGRNEVMFNCAVYAKKRYKDDYEPELDKMNATFNHPPLPRGEINAIVKQMGKKDYYYKCKQAPLCNHCNKDLCRHREFGIGGTDDPGVMIDGISKLLTEPPLWFVSVNNVRIPMETDEFLSQAKFRKCCVEVLTIAPSMISAKAWLKMVNKLLKNADHIDAPEDASPRGQLMYLLEQFCTTKAQARLEDEVLLGKPWTDNGNTYFRSHDLYKYLEQQKFKAYKEHKIYSVINEALNVQQVQKKIKGKNVRMWSVPEFVHHDEHHEPARVPESTF